MTGKPTYEELEQRVKELERKVDSGLEKVKVSDINIEWNINQGRCTFEDLPVAMMWIDTTLAGLMSGVQAMVGTKRFGLALQSEGRKSVEEDWRVISQFSDFRDGFKAIANIAAVAGWGEWELVAFDENEHQCTFRIKNSWEGRYQKSLGINWGSGMLAGKMAGYSSKLFNTNCWAEQTRFIARGDEFDEFVVKPSIRSIEDEIANLLLTDEATRADMAVALKKLHKEVSERKQAEEALRESEERYRSLFRNNHSVMLLIDPESADIVDANPAAVSYYGWGHEELTAKNITEINIHTKEHVFQEMEKAKSEQRRQFIFRHRLSSGDIRDVEIYSGPIKLHGQKLLYSIIHDITDRKRAEQALRESEEKFRTIFSSAPVGIAIANPGGRFIEVNDAVCKMLGYSAEEFREKTFLDITYPDDFSETQRLAMEVWESKRDFYRSEKRYLTKDGSPIWATVNASAVRDRSGKVKYWVGIMEDITHSRHMEEQLRQAQKIEAVGTLTGGIAHDFNNILGIILGNAELALDNVPELNPARLNLEEIRIASLRAKDVVRQLLSFARKTKLERKPTNLTPIVRESIKLLRSSIPASIDIRQNISKDIDTILADPTQINQVLINLCTNADHAMPDGGVILVTLKNTQLDQKTAIKYPDFAPGRYVNLTVADTGHGIPKEEIDRIFDPYFTTKEVGKGTGMGLAVVHGIVKEHSGLIKVESELGKGTAFSIYFPAIEKAVVIETEIDEEIPSGSESILFIDDEASLVKLGCQKLERLGYKVKGTTNPIEALDRFRSKPDQYDLIITDMTMPQMTGDKLVKEILNIRPGIPVILCTGFSEKIDEKKAKEMGVADYIEKPHEMRALAKMVRKVLERNM